MRAVIDDLSYDVPAPLTELRRLGRTLKQRAVDVLAYFDHGRHLERPDGGDQRTARTPTWLRPGVPQPDQLHHPITPGDRRLQNPPTPSFGMSRINSLLLQIKQERGIDVPLHVDGASGGFVWPFLYPDSEWDFRLEQVRSINVSGHKFGLVYPGIGWLIFRESFRPRAGPRLRGELPRQDRRHLHPELLHRVSDGARAVLQPRPIRPRRLHVRHAEHADQRTPPSRQTRRRSGGLSSSERDQEQLPLARSQACGSKPRLRRVRHRMAAVPPNAVDGPRLHAATQRPERDDHAGPGQGNPPAANTSTPSPATSKRPADHALRKGGAHHSERQKVVTGPGH